MTAPPFPFHRLSDRAVLAVSGADAPGFLQGLVTADVRGLAAGEARYGALLTPQGKILFDFFIVGDNDGFLIDCARDQREALSQRLGFYRLRAKVAIVARDDLAVAASPTPQAAAACYRDPRHADLGYRLLVDAGQAPAADGSEYRRLRLALGIADSAEIGSGQLYPHEANLDRIGGVSFNKGCYVGQEVVSRMEHRGTARSRVCAVVLSQGSATPGSDILAGGKPVGALIAVDGLDGLALIRLDRATEAATAGQPLLTDGATVHVRQPPGGTTGRGG
jgi:hypothetical protein